MKNIEDYEFIKIGQAKLSERPIKAKGTSGDYRLIINLIDEKFLHAEQSAYLVYVEDELIYAGYYSGSFQDRWLRKQKGQYYCWHSDKLDDEINALVKKNKNVSVWLTIDPYAILEKNGKKVNISKLIEDTIIMKLKPKLNKVGKYLEENKKNTLSVEEIARGL